MGAAKDRGADGGQEREVVVLVEEAGGRAEVRVRKARALEQERQHQEQQQGDPHAARHGRYECAAGLTPASSFRGERLELAQHGPDLCTGLKVGIEEQLADAGLGILTDIVADLIGRTGQRAPTGAQRLGGETERAAADDRKARGIASGRAASAISR